MILPAINFVQETKQELAKVIWPPKNQIIKLTSQVIIVSIFFALFAGGLDYLFTTLSQFIFQ